MATKKNKNAKGLGDLPDFTFNEPKKAVIRFNSACVVALAVDEENGTIRGNLIDELAGERYSFEAVYKE